MKTKNRNSSKLFLLAFAFLAVACSKDSSGDDNPDPQPTATTFEDVIKLGADPESFPESRTEEVLNESVPENEDYNREEEGETVTERFICTTKTLSVEDGNGQFPLFNTNADVIYPGNLLQGKTLSSATPSPIVVKRAGGTISYNLNNGNPNSSFAVTEVKKSSIQDAMNGIIGDGTGTVPDNFTLDIIQIESESHMAIEMGISVETFVTKVSSDMSFSSDKSYNRTLVKLKQSFYTMSFDLPTSLDEIFDESVTPENLATYVQADNPATFISSVTYGRIFYMLIESTSSRQEMEAKLNIAYGAFKNKAEAEVNVEAFNSLKEVKIKIIAYGGTGSERVAGASNISEIVDRLAESKDITAGLPLSYVVRSVERPDKIVGVKLATEYDVVECELKGILPPGFYTDLVDLFDDGIGAMGWVSNSDVIIFNKAGDKYAWYNGNTPGILSDGDRRIFDITDTTAPLGGIALEEVGAIVHFDVNKLYIFNGNGFQFQILNIDPAKVSGNSLPTEAIGSYALNGNIYSVNADFGDSAGLLFSNGFTAGVNIGNPMAFFEKDSEFYQIYNKTGNGSWSQKYDSNNWFVGQDHNGPNLFEKVGAATRFTIGGTNTRYLFVNDEGNELMEWFSNASINDVFEGPWVIN